MKTTDIAIATPCGQDWQSMSPREKSRFCGECKKVVHDLRTMKEKDAKALLSTPSTEGLCVRYMYDEEGNVWFQDTMFMRTEGLLKKVAAAAAIAAVPFLTACMGSAGYDGAYGVSADTQGPSTGDLPQPDSGGGHPGADAGPSAEGGPVDPGADAAVDPDPNADPDAATDPDQG